MRTHVFELKTALAEGYTPDEPHTPDNRISTQPRAGSGHAQHSIMTS